MTNDTCQARQGVRFTAPSFVVRSEGGVVGLFGEWTALSIGTVEKSFTAFLGGARVSGIDMEGVTRLDTAGALFLYTLASGGGVTVRTYDTEHARLMDMAARLGGSDSPQVKGPGLLLSFLEAVGEAVVAQYRLGVNLVSFLGEYLVTSFGVLCRPHTLPATSLVYHMQQVGVSAVPIVTLLSFLIGLVIAYMGAQQLARFGAEIFVINLVEITTLRELGVLLTSIVIAGRSGSSFTAQIGAMKSNQEVDAMRTMGLSPMLRLAFPRITALVIMLPALVFLADMMGLLGGAIAVWSIMDMSPAAYLARMQGAIQTSNFVVGLVKAPFFAVVIGVIGCYQGFQVTGSAESVGRLTTQAVVEAIFLVILLDALFALFFTGIGV